jgi:hypothetical protein
MKERFVYGACGKGIETFVKGLEMDGTLTRWGKERKRQSAKTANRRIIKAVNETLAEMEGAKFTK